MNFDGKTAESGKTTAMAKALYETASRDTLILHRHRRFASWGYLRNNFGKDRIGGEGVAGIHEVDV